MAGIRQVLGMQTRFVECLQQQLDQKDKQIEALTESLRRTQEQLQVLLDDRFHRPVITDPTPGKSVMSSTSEHIEDQPMFDDDQRDDIADDIDAAIERIAEEVGFTGRP